MRPEHQIAHRLKKRKPSLDNNGQGKHLSRTGKEVPVKRDDDTHDPLKMPLTAFVNADTFAKKLKTRKGLTPYQFIIKTGQKCALKVYPLSKPSHTGGCTPEHLTQIQKECVYVAKKLKIKKKSRAINSY